MEERQTRRIRMLEFLGTACFVLLAACSLDSCLVEYGGKVSGLGRPLKSALFLPCYGLLVLLGSPYPDNVFAPFDLRDASAQAEVVKITVELFLNGVLAEFARWFVTSSRASSKLVGFIFQLPPVIGCLGIDGE